MYPWRPACRSRRKLTIRFASAGVRHQRPPVRNDPTHCDILTARAQRLIVELHSRLRRYDLHQPSRATAWRSKQKDVCFRAWPMEIGDRIGGGTSIEWLSAIYTRSLDIVLYRMRARGELKYAAPRPCGVFAWVSIFRASFASSSTCQVGASVNLTRPTDSRIDARSAIFSTATLRLRLRLMTVRNASFQCPSCDRY